jgi:DNA-binding NarL/FixJ family response regulator
MSAGRPLVSSERRVLCAADRDRGTEGGVVADQRRIRVLFVEDHQLLADALSAMLAREPDIEVVGVAGSVAEAKAMSRDRLDVVLMDYQLPDGTGAEATRAIKARWPAARVVMVTALTDDETVLESIQAGADGYLTKDRAAEDVVLAVRAANAGETLLPRSVIVEIARRVAAARERGDDRRVVEPLTPRELEVLRALTEGLSTPEICEQLFIAPNTLRTHVQNIMGKLRVHSKLEAVAFALRYRLVEPPRPEDTVTT